MIANPSPRPIVIAAAAMGAAVLLTTSKAYAFLGVGDTGDGVLAGLLANSIKQLAEMTEMVRTAQRSYNEARKVVGYAEDAYAFAASFQHFSLERFGRRLHSELDNAYPDAAALRDQMLYGRWAENGRLVPLLKYCMNGTLSRNGAGEIVFDREKLCTHVRQELGTSQVLEMLGAVFGTVPESETKTANGIQAAVVDAEVAAQIAAQTAQWNRTQRVKQVVEQMEADCAKTSSAAGPSAVCEAAAQRAQMASLAEQAETNRLLSENARLLALQLAQRNAELKAAMTAASERRAAMSEDAKTLGSQTFRIKAGNSLF